MRGYAVATSQTILKSTLAIVMRDNIAHAAYFLKGELGDGLAARRAYVCRGLSDNFNTPDDGTCFCLSE